MHSAARARPTAASSCSRLDRGIGPSCPVANFDSVRFIGDIENTLLDLLVNFPGRVYERFFHVVGGLGRSFHEDQAMFFCKLLSFFIGNCTSVIEIALVSNQHYCHVGIRMLPRIFQPTRQVVECFAPGDIVDQQSASSTPVVRPRDRAEGFLTSLQERRMVKLEVSPRRLPSPPKRCERSNGSKAYRVPDLQFDLFVVNGHHSRTELHSDGQVVDRLKSFVGELEQQA